jgi:hypothetical protein
MLVVLVVVYHIYLLTIVVLDTWGDCIKSSEQWIEN